MASCEIPASPLNFPKSVDVNDELPPEETLAKIGGYPLLDVNGNQVPFRSVYEGINGEKKNHKVLMIFVRHFFCGNCQDYLEYLSNGLPLSAELEALPKPVSVIVIGCGAPSLIPFYAEKTSCTCPIYSDPTRYLYSVLQMTRTILSGETPRESVKTTSLVGHFVRSAGQSLSRVKQDDMLKGGSSDQVGGEFLFEDEKVTWCHRMRNATDHSELRKIREVLGLPVPNS